MPPSALVLLLAATGFVQAQWIESKSANYSVFYQSGYEKDVESTRTILDQAEDLLKSKYGVPFSGFHVAVYLYPAPTQSAGIGLANLQCCSRRADGIKTGTISYLAPSALEWKDAKSTSLGLPKDENYHAKVLMSEYMTVGHYVVQESRAMTGGWRYGRAPEWFTQGLQEYEGIFHTSDVNRDMTKAALFAWARTHQSAFACCSSGLAISDVYNGGATFTAFLAANFGEDIHARLLRDTSTTFDEAFKNQTKPYHLSALFEEFRSWLARTATARP